MAEQSKEVVRLLEDYLDIIEARSALKSGIFQSKLKYFLFLNGGVATLSFLVLLVFRRA